MSTDWLPEAFQFSRETAWLWPANVALAAVSACLLGLLAGRLLKGRPVPLRHGLLLATIGLTLVCPLAVTVSSWLGLGVISIPIEAAVETARPAGSLEPASNLNETPIETRSVLSGPNADFVVEPAETLALGQLAPLKEEQVEQTNRAATPARHTTTPQKESDRQESVSYGGVFSLANFAAPVAALFITAWLAGVLWCAARLGRGLVLLRRLRKTLSPVEDDRVASASRSAFQAAGVSPETAVLESPHAPLPLTLGLFRPVVVLPVGLGAVLDDDELFCVLAHEAAHIRRRDQWVGLAQRLASATFWWNPLLHRINRNIARLREHICDDCVVAAHGDGRPLATALVKVAECWSAPAMPLPAASTLVDEVEELSERINRLFNQERAMTIRLNGKAMNVVLAFSLLLSAVLFFPTLRPASAQDEAGSRKARSTERGKSTREKRQAKRNENKRGLNKRKESARNQQSVDGLGQKYALEFATTLLIFFDKDRDGHLTREEVAASQWPHAVNVWADADSNQDKRVSRQELKDSYSALYLRERKAGGRPTHEFGEEAWRRTDTNRDGQIDRKEARNSFWLPAEQVWFRGDLDRDDKLTVSEMRIQYAMRALDKSIRLRAAAAARKQPATTSARTSVPVRVKAVETMIISHFDIDRDGTLGPIEIRKMPWPSSVETFLHCDLNRDGKVSISELSDTLDLVYRRNSRQRLEMPDRFAMSNWKQFDMNRDGSIDLAESKRTPYKNVANWFRSDLNSDGKLSLSEMNLSFNVVALDKSIRMKQAVEKKHAPAKPADPGSVGVLGNLRIRSKVQEAREERIRRQAAAHYAYLILKRFDLNKDGRIDRAEARKAPWPKSEQVWFQGSRKRDESIDDAELRAQFQILQGVLEKSGQQDTRSHTTWLLKVVDRNGDSHIDKAETQLTSWPNAGNNWFKGDSNADGKVNYDELLVAMAMNAQDKGVRLAEAELERLNSVRKAQP